MGIRKVGIVGSGTMAGQIAELLLKYGFEVTLYSRTDDGIKNCLARFKDKELASRLITTANFEGLEGNNLLIESVKEDAKVKQEIFENLDQIASNNAIIASNTSSIPLSLISKKCKNRKNILGIHFFNPVAHAKLVEITKPGDLSEENFDKVLEFVKKLDKEPIIVKDTPGFICNRLLFAMLNEAAKILHEGIGTKEDIDKAMMLGALHPAGPFKIMDLIGIDVVVDILNNLKRELNDKKFEPSPILLRMVEENKLGRKTAKGFYDYK